MKVLVTGGAGYIGSHTCVELLARDHELCVVDNLSNGNIKAIENIGKISGKPVNFFNADIRDNSKMSAIFSSFSPDTVVHFAGLKSISESFVKSSLYYDVNVNGSRVLLDIMNQVGCKHIVFSSSATVYGKPEYLPYDELHKTRPENPYGKNKLEFEVILRNWADADSTHQATALRYFNPVGAHVSTLLGENLLDTTSNLMPHIAQVAIGRLSALSVFGNDYPTIDGTGIRDYIHVVDLASAHVAAIAQKGKLSSFEAINIGSGVGTSVLQLVEAFEIASGVKIKVNYGPRRSGDLAIAYANPDYAFEKLGWETKLTVSDMCVDTWAWQKNNKARLNK